MLKLTISCLAIGLLLATNLCNAQNGQADNIADIQPTGTVVSQPLAELPVWRFDGFVELLEVPEPSGLCYHPGRDTLFIVDDGDLERSAAVTEINLSAEVLQSRSLGIDLEGICYCSIDEMLYITDEIGETIYVVDPEGLVLTGTVTYSRKYGNDWLLTAGGNGVEGIDFIPNDEDSAAGYFLLLNQDDPHCVFRINHEDINLQADAAAVPIRAYWPVKNLNLGELHFEKSTRELWIIHSWMNVMEIWDIDSMQLLRWEVVPGSAQEALTIDGQGRLWVGYDSGGIARYVVPGASPEIDDDAPEVLETPPVPAPPEPAQNTEVETS